MRHLLVHTYPIPKIFNVYYFLELRYLSNSVIAKIHFPHAPGFDILLRFPSFFLLGQDFLFPDIRDFQHSRDPLCVL
jgi:hypothetical protein